MIGENRLDPQLAMKVVANFDRAMAEVLSEKVKARLTFKVSLSRQARRCWGLHGSTRAGWVQWISRVGGR